MRRNSLTPENVVSCIFTATRDLNAEFPAVAARAVGFDRVPLLVCAGDPGPAVDATCDQGADPLLRRGRARARARLPRQRARAADRPERGTVVRPARSAVTAELNAVTAGAERRHDDAAQCARGDRVLRAHQAHSDLPRRGRLRAAGAARAPGQQRVAIPAAAGRARGDRARARHAQPLPRPLQLAAAPAPQRALRRARLANRDRQRLLRHPARGRRGAAGAGRGARLCVAVVLGLSASQRGLGRAGGDGRARRRTSGTTCERCCARSPSRRGW